MTDPSPAGHFDQRYATEEYWYGTLPNDFLKEHVASLPWGGRVLCLGEGEGRNAVFLAAQGFDVVAVDASAVGLAKAERLARERHVSIATVRADLADYALGESTWDGIISIWCHLPPALRARVHHDVGPALRAGGVFLLEAYTPAQLEFKTGGPKSAELLPTLAALRQELGGLRFELAIERERDVHEGRGHSGHSAVVQIIARRSD